VIGSSISSAASRDVAILNALYAGEFPVKLSRKNHVRYSDK
jgi:hypothetical protein